MPAAAHDDHWPGAGRSGAPPRLGSHAWTRSPASAARQATASPIAPPPTMTTSALPEVIARPPFAGITRGRLWRSVARRHPLSPDDPSSRGSSTQPTPDRWRTDRAGLLCETRQNGYSTRQVPPDTGERLEGGI